ncbi:tetratricopeptide repeat protein [Chryseobacterium foetidum]|uniref:tetratricopeptide repeat protein n=1 Tax=Chryseobacterium foetidum TaxID=2951057 RepID=UPI0021C94A25|nr:tetratricopeptide repeat protein [Chryseobacterium foetidum]
MELFKSNILLFSYGTNAFDRLGEIYLELGNFELTVKNYQKALQINPDNTHAKEIISEIKKKVKLLNAYIIIDRRSFI